MATQFFFKGATQGPVVADLSSDTDIGLALTRGTSLITDTRLSVAGPTGGLQVPQTSTWWYQVNAVTISGSITANLWMHQSNMAANSGAQIIIDRCDSTGAFVSTVWNSEKGTELSTSTAVQNWSGTPTSTAFSAGDYIRARVYFNDAGGTMASGYTLSFGYQGATGGASGDSYVTFTETIDAYAGSQTVTPTTAALTTTTFAPTVTASDHKTVTPGVASLALATFAPSAIIGNIVVPTTASLSLATFAPTVSVSDNKVATPDVASLSLATFAPSIAITDHKTVVPDVAVLVLATFAPTVTASDHKIVTPDVAALVLTTFTPTVTGGAGTTVTPTTASLVLATFAPTVTASDHKTVVPGPLALTLTAFAPDVTAGAGSTTRAHLVMWIQDDLG